MAAIAAPVDANSGIGPVLDRLKFCDGHRLAAPAIGQISASGLQQPFKHPQSPNIAPRDNFNLKWQSATTIQRKRRISWYNFNSCRWVPSIPASKRDPS
jgi:hypothetical protein